MRKTKKTNEEFIIELQEKNPNIKPLEEYKGALKKIRVECKTCGYQWETTPNCLISKKTGCAKCSGVYKMTQKEYKEKVLSVNPNITLIGEYTGSHNPIEAKCNLCGNIWFPIAGNLLRGHGCKSCNSPIKKSHEQFEKEASENNKYIKILGKYTCVEKPILVRCLLCGEEYMTQPQGILNGCVHKNCVRKVKEFYKQEGKPHSDFVKEVEDLGKNVEILSQYVNQKTKILVRCKNCGLERWTTPQVLLRENGTGCPTCSTLEASKSLRKSHKVFVEDVYKINSHIEILSTYTKQTDNILVKCKLCGHENYRSADKLLTRIYNCPVCSDKISFPNKFMMSLLLANNIEFESEKIFEWSENKRYDFYIPSTSTIIEMNGAQHYRERKKPNSNWGKSCKEIQKNDMYKKELALKNGIKNYVEIDASESLPDYISNSIQNSFISYLLDDINISEILQKCLLQSKVMDVVNYYNKGIVSTTKLCKLVDITGNTCRKYIKLAKEAKLIA